MQKLPEASNRRKERRMRKEKKDLLTEGGNSFSFSNDQRSENTLLINEDATRSSLDDALASPFTSSTRLYAKIQKATKWTIELRTKTLDLDKHHKSD